MFKNASFHIAFIVSIIIHALLLYFLPNIRAFQDRRITPELEITYRKLPKSETLKIKSTLTEKKSPINKIDTQDLPVKLQDLARLGLEKPTLKEMEIAPNKEPILPPTSLAKKKVTLPEIEQPKIKNPAYLNYYQAIREKIKQFAYNNFTKLQEGEIYVSFIIDSSGNLKEIKVMDEKSSEDPYLKKISQKSIRDASPYPAFPKELGYPELSFNVIISYEID